MSFIEVTINELGELTPSQFSEVLLRLLKFESEKYNFQSSANILVPLNINVADEGEDGRIVCDSTNGSPWIRNNFTIYQMKTYDLQPKKIFKEFFTKDSLRIQPSIEEALDEGGEYVLFISKAYTAAQLKKRIEAAHRTIEEINSKFQKNYSVYQVRLLEGNQIKDWVNDYLYVVLRIKEYLKSPLPEGLMTIEQLGKYKNLTTPEFVSNDWVMNFKSVILQELSIVRKSIRLVGHSGVGKTRLVYEVFKNEGEFAKNAIYYDASNAAPGFVGFVHRVVSQTRTIFIIDNCSKELHEKLQAEVERFDSQCSLLTISSSVHEFEDYYNHSGGVNLILYLAKENEDILPKLIRNLYGNQILDIEVESVHRLTDNYPAMAIRLHKIRKGEGAQQVTKIIDDDKIDKILYGNSPPKNRDIRLYTSIIKVLSIFEYFPSYDILVTNPISQTVLDTQINFIIENICKIDKRTFKEVCLYFVKQKILISRGRYLTVSPTPLAIKLALDWWRVLPNDEIEKFFEDVTKHGLGVFLVNRLRYLDASPEVQSQLEVIIGELGLLGKTEVLNTELGSRLFSSLTEVNPEASIRTLEKLYFSTPISDLRDVTEGRQYIVWSLQKLCFRKETFNRAAKILYRFAQVGNEGWINNARGIFKQLFRPRLGGTEADLNARLEILHFAITQPFVGQNEFLIEAVMAAFEIRGVSRIIGAEFQSTKVLKDYKPKDSEITSYWEEIIRILKKIWATHLDLRTLIEKQFYFKSLQIISYGKIELVIDFVNWLESNEIFIPSSFFNSLIRKMTSDRTPETIKIGISTFLESKKPRTKKEIFMRQVRDATFPHGRDQNGKEIEQTEEIVREIAHQFYDDGVRIVDILDLMLRGQQRYTEVFVAEYLSRLDQREYNKYLWDLSVEELVKIEAEDRNWAVLQGILKSSPKEEKLNLILRLGEIKGFEQIFIRFVNYHLLSVNELDMIWELIVRRDIKPEIVSDLRMGYFAYNESFDASRFICDKLKFFGDQGYWSIIDILASRLVHGKRGGGEEWEYCRELFFQFDYFKLDNKPEFLDLYDLTEISKKLLNKFPDDGLFNRIADCLLSYLKSTQSVEDEYQLSELTDQLIELNFKAFWIKLSEVLLSSDVMMYNIHNMIGSNHSFPGTYREGVLFSNPLYYDTIIGWCKQNIDKGLLIIAYLMPIYDSENKTWHPFAKKMIHEFGDNSDFLTIMSSNMGSFGFVGSPIGYYENEIKMYEQLLGHSIPQVKDFALKQIETIHNYIKREKLDEEERFLGL
ncbi:MAG: hypothetical protein LCH52_02225 [Bacteroidetes bacterium]|nr:hypothetical protein [Bacteroidota bacterium]